MHIDYKQVGQRIKQERKRKRMTQEQLAEGLRVSVGYVSQVERGTTKISLDLLAAIATVLDSEIALFLDGVTIGQKSYLETELQSQISKLPPEKKHLLLKIVEALCEAEF